MNVYPFVVFDAFNSKTGWKLIRVSFLGAHKNFLRVDLVPKLLNQFNVNDFAVSEVSTSK